MHDMFSTSASSTVIFAGTYVWKMHLSYLERNNALLPIQESQRSNIIQHL